MKDELQRAMSFYPAEPGNQIPRAHLLLGRGALTLGEDWAVLLWGDELCLGGDPFASPLDPGRINHNVDIDVGLSCGVPARSRIAGEPGDTEARHALPDADWVGFCFADSCWEPLLRFHFHEVHRWTRVGFLGGRPLPPPSWPTRPLEPGDIPDLEALDQPWLWKYHGGPGELVEGATARCAVDEGRLRSVSIVYAADEEYADIAVATHPDCRRRGLGRSAVIALCHELERAGLTPFWQTDVENTSSVRIPLSLGWPSVELPPMYTLNRRPPACD